MLLPFLEVIQPFLSPICLIGAWMLVAMVGWSLGTAARDSWVQAKQMHQIPCAYCQFFTNDHRLKCTVHPHMAGSESAINCSDYRPNTSPGSSPGSRKLKD